MPASVGLEALFVRLYLDRHIMTRLAADLVGHGYDVLTTQEAGRDAASDEEQLAFATTESRAILTFNIRDFALLHERWQAASQSHSGIVVFQQLGSRQYGLLLQRTLRFLNHFTAEEMIGNFVHLELSSQSVVGQGRSGGSTTTMGRFSRSRR
jgi:predicted nuclease of predicted toxin-antitoxin system